MKKNFFCFLLILLAFDGYAQLRNPDFELLLDSNPFLPQDWKVKTKGGYKTLIDNQVSYKGKNSYSIQLEEDSVQEKFFSFSQKVDLSPTKLNLMNLNVFVKTSDVKNGPGIGIWCQVRNKDSKMIGFQNLEQQGTIIQGTNEWKRYTLKVILDTNCRQLLLGGYLAGTGKAWFDNFSLTQLELSKTVPSKQVNEYAVDLLNHVKKQSIYAKQINWIAMTEQVNTLISGIDSLKDARFIGEFVLDKLRQVGDNHSFIQSADLNQKHKSINLDSRRPRAMLLDSGIAYIYVPGFSSIGDSASKSFAMDIQNYIKEYDTKHEIRGWVVDLSENTGGNMYPMIAGLGPLIGNGVLGYFHNVKDKAEPWYYKKGVTNYLKLKNIYTLKNPNAKVAVIIGPNTASSGEMTTISFIGRPNTKLFGQATGGFTTGNEIFTLKDQTGLALATSYTSNRFKVMYLSKIEPDVYTKEGEQTLRIAQKWLLGR